MKLSVQFPMHTRSENDARSLPFAVARVAKTKGPKAANGLAIAIAQRTAKQRREVRMVLDSQLPRLKRSIHMSLLEARASTRADVAAEVRRRDGGWDPMQPVDNFYRVTLIRISAGELDTDGLAGALKAVRDEVAAWLGIDDSARSPASWRYGQQRGPRGVHAVRIEIEDDDPDQRKVHKIVGAPIAKLGLVVGDVQHAPRTVMDMPNEAYRRETAELDAIGPRLSVAQVARGLGMTTAQLREMAPMKCADIERRSSAPPRRSWDPTHPLDEHLRDNRMRARPPSLTRRAAMRAKAGGLLPRNACIVEQEPLVFRRSYHAPPGQDNDADEVTLEELTGALFERDEPPPRIIKGGRELRRRQDFHPALGEHWIYEPAPSAARAHEERAEARR